MWRVSTSGYGLGPASRPSDNGTPPSEADLVCQNTDGQTAIWLMNGSTFVGSALLGNPGASWHAIGTGDFNGDGKADIN